MRYKSLDKIVKSGRKYNLTKGQLVQASDLKQNITFVESGYIKRYLITNDGSLSVQAIYGPGNIFPLTLVFSLVFNYELDPGIEIFYYETMSETVIYTLDAKTFMEKIEDDPLVYKDLLRVAGIRLSSNIQRLDNNALRTSYEQLAHELLYLAREYGDKTKDGIKIKVPLTHGDIAGILNTSRETITLKMNDLKEMGLIKTGDGILIPSIEDLENAAYQ